MKPVFERARWPLTVAAACLLLAGCQDAGKKAPKIHKMEGVAKAINTQTKEVSMSIRMEDGSYVDRSAILRDDAEILVNGRVQKINDVHAGDKVTAYFHKDPANDSKYIVTKVEVVRAADSDWKTASGSPSTPTITPGGQPDTSATGTGAQPFGSPPNPTQATDASTEDRTRKEADTFDAIYGEVRRQMEEAIQKRKDMLASGTDPSDPDVRQLEQKIMKAKGLLEERGEIVEEIDPPIVTPRQTPPG